MLATLPVAVLAQTLFIAGLVLALAGVFAWSLRAEKPAGSGNTLAQERTRLIKRIADLDDSHARGELDDADWQSQRAALKRDLLDVARQLEASQQGSR